MENGWETEGGRETVNGCDTTTETERLEKRRKTGANAAVVTT